MIGAQKYASHPAEMIAEAEDRARWPPRDLAAAAAGEKSGEMNPAPRLMSSATSGCLAVHVRPRVAARLGG